MEPVFRLILKTLEIFNLRNNFTPVPFEKPVQYAEQK